MKNSENRFVYTDKDCPEIETGDLREILPHTLYILRYGVERDEETDLESDEE